MMAPKLTEMPERYERMMDAMVPMVQQHLVAISAWYKYELHQHATGSLVRFSDHYFLITAAHAIEQFHQGLDHYEDLHLLIDNGDGNQLVPLYGPYRATSLHAIPIARNSCSLANATTYWTLVSGSSTPLLSIC